MNSIDFCYWLQGHFEISETSELNEKQVEIIKNHLNLVFKHEIDGIYEKGELQNIHDGKPPTGQTVLPGHHHISPNDEKIRC